MSWIGLSDPFSQTFDLAGLAGRMPRRPAMTSVPEAALACRGTILLEVMIDHRSVPRILASVDNGPGFAISIAFTEGNWVEFNLRIDGANWRHTLKCDIDGATQPVRIAYAWDAATRAAIFSLFQPASGRLVQVLVDGPRPIRLIDLAQLTHAVGPGDSGNHLNFLAISRAFLPTGPMPGIAGRTLVETDRGLVMMNKLGVDDAFLMADGSARKPVAIARRTLPARGSFAPVALKAPFFGLERDVLLSQESRVLMAGADVEFLLGSEAVLAPADQLRDGVSVMPVRGRATMTYYLPIFDTVDIFQAGVGVSSLDLGAGRPDQLSLASTLWADVATPHAMRHGNCPFPEARRYEVVTLNAARAA
ncbi:MAG: Hint domain-containing protein [Pseudomonadota bacterium]